VARRRPKKAILLDAFTQPDIDTWNRHGDAVQAASDPIGGIVQIFSPKAIFWMIWAEYLK
jgi:hypothetical protein